MRSNTAECAPFFRAITLSTDLREREEAVRIGAEASGQRHQSLELQKIMCLAAAADRAENAIEAPVKWRTPPKDPNPVNPPMLL